MSSERGARVAIVGRPGSGVSTQVRRLVTWSGAVPLTLADLAGRAGALGHPVDGAPGGHLDAAALGDAYRACREDPEIRRRGLVLDGVPASLAQARALAPSGADEIDLVVHLVVPADVARRRLASVPATADGRLGSPGRVAAPVEDRVLSRRRLARHDAGERPLLEWFRERGLLVTVDGVGPETLVFDRLGHALRARLTDPTVVVRPTGQRQLVS